MNVQLGVDSLCYHCRLAAGEIDLEGVLREGAELGFEFVQINAVHVAGADADQLAEVRGLADQLGLALTLSGDVIGRASRGDTPAEGAERVARWITLAQAIGSPFARISSGFYRADLWHDLGAIAAEQEYVTEALRRAATDNDSGVRILLENHSDFTPEEYVEIIEAVSSEQVGVFLDVINPVSVFADPEDTIRRLAPLSIAGHVKDFRLKSRYVPDGFHRTGFDLRWCYPGEGVAQLDRLLGTMTAHAGADPYRLSIEGLDNQAGVADQAPRLRESLKATREALNSAAPAPA